MLTVSRSFSSLLQVASEDPALLILGSLEWPGPALGLVEVPRSSSLRGSVRPMDDRHSPANLVSRLHPGKPRLFSPTANPEKSIEISPGIRRTYSDTLRHRRTTAMIYTPRIESPILSRRFRALTGMLGQGSNHCLAYTKRRGRRLSPAAVSAPCIAESSYRTTRTNTKGSYGGGNKVAVGAGTVMHWYHTTMRLPSFQLGMSDTTSSSSTKSE